MKIKLRHWLIISTVLSLVMVVSACAHKSTKSSTGPSYQKSNKVVTDKSLNDQVLSVRHNKEKIVGHLYTAKTNVKHRPIAIISHGLGGNYQELEAYARRLAKRGYLAYAFDFPGGSTNGQSTGLKQTQMSIYTEEQSLLAVITALRSRKDVDKNNVLLVGGSQGASYPP
ncbi:hypothetical protein D1831_09965 [Lactiplantibacillus garii]|uniref:Serine aminopeptidase S33 domain-containing protein n=1 Tax=Lactiplantibacillus garii TaxID=2306423 RepID=A0A426D5V6_9LACO|nr:hypothetical protein [Lactiplantibacillus garii]RRK09951.1 hypothetical protein D1831_09965 [Lactiplantibacillus garii]